MSEGNLEAVRRWLDWPGHPAQEERDRLIDEIWVEDCDYYPVRRFPEAEPCHGREAVRRFMNYFVDAWEHWEVRVVEVATVGDVRALAHTHIRAVGKGSGVDLDGEVFHGFWFRQGRILRLEDHLTERGAREGLGLESGS
jgi:SnoaL-like protein